MTTSVAAGVDRLARQSRPSARVYVKAVPCRCEEKLVFEYNHCSKCGRDLRWLGLEEAWLLFTSEAYALLDAAIELSRRDLALLVQEQSGCSSFVELMKETYWLADALREDWVPA